MKTFFDAYVTIALWSSMDESTPNGGEPMDANYSRKDIAPKTLSKMKRDCQDFFMRWGGTIDLAMNTKSGYTVEHAGHDFWLTRNGHGSGFWDQDLGEVGDILTHAAKELGEFGLYVGDDGQIYGD